MESTISTLRTNLRDAQQEAETLKSDLKHARQEIRNLQAEATTALANVAILSDHVREYVDASIPFPRLRRVPRVG
jgi:arginine deiminase